MSIDGIGKPGRGIPPTGAGSIGGAPNVGSSNAVFRVETAAGTEKAEATSSDALRALEKGELSVDGYLEVRITEATQHLAGLPPEQLELVKQTLRDQLRSDPVLLELVRRTTGAVLE